MNLLFRVLTAVVLLPGVVWLVWIGGWWLFGLVLLATAVALYEYFHMWAGSDVRMVATGVLIGLGPALVSMLAPRFLGEAMVATMLLTVLGFTVNPGPFETTWKRMATTVLGLAYCGVTLTVLYRLRAEAATPAIGAGWIYLAMIVTWGNDTCAYFAGRLFGRHKLFPLLSPKKTWEGAVGGLAGSIGGALLAHFWFAQHLGLVEALAIGLVAGVLAPLGDLAESLLKRSFEAKDSGRLLPGHGGLLDRVDALMITGPFVYLVATFVHPLLDR
ncbi:MAG: phosphatidate cytidylyltransferase [Deltaproteobacteria bacterium]|nr:phosphatidate cytidylyltransferase [Deltaproteobacteria bacterium]